MCQDQPQYCFKLLQLIFMDLWGQYQSVGNRDISVQKLHHKMRMLHLQDVMDVSKHH